MMQDVQHYLRPGLLQLSELPPLSLYVHLPWCLKKCPYCDFNSHESVQIDQSGKRQHPLEDRYVDALLTDLEASLPWIWGRPLQTVFLGGGTPSLFSPAAIDRLISGIRARVPLVSDAEITMEANPGTYESGRFSAFSQAGITRLSLGVQSFNDEALQALGRVHNAEQAQQAAQEVARAFATWNLDLMYALPQQTLQALAQDLDIALSLEPPHLSIYQLTLEPNTLFAKYPPSLPDEDTAYAMLDHITSETSGAGLHRYEVSAFAEKGHHCRHNLNYWLFGDYLGIGAGAHSKLSFPHRVLRQVRYREPLRYMDQALQRMGVAQEHEVKLQELPFEFMLNALRLKQGFSISDYCARTGCAPSSIAAAVAEGLKRGLLERQVDQIRASEKGFDFLSDLQSLFLPSEADP